MGLEMWGVLVTPILTLGTTGRLRRLKGKFQWIYSKRIQEGTRPYKNSLVVSNILYFHPYLGKISNLTIFFFFGWVETTNQKIFRSLPKTFTFISNFTYPSTTRDVCVDKFLLLTLSHWVGKGQKFPARYLWWKTKRLHLQGIEDWYQKYPRIMVWNMYLCVSTGSSQHDTKKPLTVIVIYRVINVITLL